MSYPKDLDEYTDEQLVKELQRRGFHREAGNCSYCGKPLFTFNHVGPGPCKQHERDTGATVTVTFRGADRCH